jgi:hypothetical protein
MFKQCINANHTNEALETTEVSFDELALVHGGGLFDWVDDAVDWVEEAAEDAVDWVEEAAEDTADWVEGAAEDVAGGIADAAEWTWNALNSDTFKKVAGTVGAVITVVSGSEKAYDYFHPDPGTEEALQAIDRSNFDA